MKKQSLPAFIKAVLPLSIVLAGQAAAAEDSSVDLGKTVVTASGFEQNIIDAPASISVISAEELNKKSYTNVMDAVRNIPGVYVTGGGDSQEISIRGMTGSYTLYMIDGKPLSAGRNVNTNGTASGTQDLALPPLSAIERVEIIRGPMSSLYGADAMGGVVNIITKDAGDEWRGQIGLEYIDSMSKLMSDGMRANVYTSGALVPGLLTANVNGSWVYDDESGFEGGSKSSGSRPQSTRRKIAGGLNLTPMANNEFSATFDVSEYNSTSTPGVSIAADEDPAESEYRKDVFTLEHTFQNANGTRVRTYLQQDISDNTAASATKRETVYTLESNVVQSMGMNVISYGGRYRQEELTDETNGLYTSGVVGAETDMDRWLAEAYVEADWALNNDLSVTTGLRYNDDELFGGHLTPRVYAVYHMTDTVTFKGGVSTGYKQPTLTDATEGFGRATGGRNRVRSDLPNALIIGNEDLDPETSTSYEVGMVFNSMVADFTTSVMLFQTDYKDKIAEDRYCDTSDEPGFDSDDASTWTCTFGSNVYRFLSTKKNIDEAQLRGVEITLDYGITQSLSMDASYTYTESEQKSGEFKGDPLNKNPKNMANVSFDWQTTDRLGLWLQGNYRGEASEYLGRNSMSDATPGYGFVDTGLNFKLKPDTTVKAGVYNVLNREVTNDDYGVVLDGRRLNVGLTVDF
ncbi:MAG: TonB-dependent receptor [Oceanospirillaceae bacterium]|nr:TonB-dependent receptor [Oceanospirillaceae bacterium]MBT14034.1 TonB-dependent receptor [Oceanospirillaceae bacterium]|tara:strand:+ start:73996 stop:76059 length:2064 start_codon:yes stop_codon:yes gene_type:complete